MSTTSNILNNVSANGAAAASSPTVAASSNSTSASEALNVNFQNFLKLLTTQLRNQDPTAPADVNQMTQEIATLSQVEQQINTNKSLQQLVSLFTSTQTNNAVSYIGKQIDAAGNQGQLSNGTAQFVYSLPAGASTATVNIANASGQVVFSGPGTTLAGRNQVLWNGTNSISGATMPNGAYNFTVTAKDAGGNPVTATTLSSGTVLSVDTQNGASTLSLGNGISIPIDKVQSIYNPGTNPGA